MFHWIVPSIDAAEWLDLLQTVTMPVLVVFVPSLIGVTAYHVIMAQWNRSGQHAMQATELLALTLMSAVAPPLISFLVYFCGWHAARHLIWLASQLEPEHGGRGITRVVVRALPLTLITVLGSAVAWWMLTPMTGSLAATVRVVFITLSMLTVPHMVITALAASNTMPKLLWFLHKTHVPRVENPRRSEYAQATRSGIDET